MITNPNNSDQMAKLYNAVRESDRHLASKRKLRNNFIRKYTGPHYPKDTSSEYAEKRVPKEAVGLMAMMVAIYLRSLVPTAPQVLVSTDHEGLRVDSRRLELAVNTLLRKIKAAGEIRLAVLDAILMMGFMKTGISAGATLLPDVDAHPTGQPYTDHCQFSDMILDFSARKWRGEAAYIGNKYRLPREMVHDFKEYNKRAREQVKASERSKTDQYGDEVTEAISQGSEPTADEQEEMVDMADIFLPRAKMIVTVEDTEGQTWDRPLRVVDDYKCRRYLGPYHVFGFGDVPGNLMSLSPCMLLADLHDLSNKIFHKATKQALDQKTINTARGTAEDDAKRIVKSSDGDTLLTDDPSAVTVHKFGGVDGPMMAFWMQIKELFTYLGGNLDALGGLSSLTQTVGQDRLLTDAAQKRMDDMQQSVHEVTDDVVLDLADHLYSDPWIELPLTHRHPTWAGVSVVETWKPEHRTADFLLYNFTLDTYSMQYQSPGTQLAILDQFVKGVLLPLQPLLQQQNATIDVEKIIKRYGKLANIRECDDLVIYLTGESEPKDGPVGSRPMKAPITQRTNVRINKPGAISSQKSQMMAQFMNGGGVQNKELASALRPTG